MHDRRALRTRAVVALSGAVAWDIFAGGRLSNVTTGAVSLIVLGNIALDAREKASSSRNSGKRRSRLHHRPKARAQAAIHTTAVGFVTIAGRLAGKRHGHLREQWLGDLRRDPCERTSLSSWRELKSSIGYVFAAVRIRVQDTLAWRTLYRVVNYVIASQSRSRFAINMILGAIAIRVYADQGFDGWFADLVSFSIAWAALDRIAVWLRKRWFPETRPQHQDSGKTPTG